MTSQAPHFASASPASPHPGGFRLRELIETFATAFILALIFRAYMVEAFVIPTGSMAPTLMGEHSQLRCPACGWEFDVGWRASGRYPNQVVLPGMVDCPNCRITLRPTSEQMLPGLSSLFQPDNARRGDRILVLKMPFDTFGTFLPKRWDVVVFKNPSEPKVNFIKRLIGLPGEAIQIVDGDVWFKPDHSPQTPWQIARKSDQVQDTLYQVVFDNDFLPRQPALENADPAPRWQTVGPATMWKGLDTRVFRFEPLTAGAKETIVLNGRWAVDYLGYNGRDREIYGHNSQHPQEERLDPTHVLVSDLRLQTVVTPEDENGQITLELSRRGVGMRAVVRGDGAVQLFRFPVDTPQAGQLVGEGKIEPRRAFRPVLVEFSFVDWRARLRIEGKDALPAYDVPIDAAMFQELLQTSDADLRRPHIRITAEGGRMELRHLRVHRDVFYRNAFIDVDDGGVTYGRRGMSKNFSPGHGCAGNPIFLFKAGKPEQDPADDQFFCMGDNSPMSADGRLWSGMNPALEYGLRNPHNADLEARMADRTGRTYQLGTVPRDYMLGRAFFVYWPWGLPLVSEKLPIVPDVGEMRFIK